ncbi:hypothetical protein JRQ81_016450 [Phrynocephalus forsythii]|uniref:Endonuclease/exonuclease/phosphatase domain-containing protein n=1 Tax=Phrynocephalus forsythii TaxID=171643 RepID=A0A9Q1B153_9SAUR|nr:hypothetical protein JRQ81_016450 [Phrynocephalus forsythii]
MGDFNARLGPNNDALFSSPLWGLTENQIFVPNYDGTSKDAKVNYGGICLTQMVSRLALIILNGNPLFDKSAKFTYVSGHGSSVVDFVLTSHLLSGSASAFCVDYRLDSDHLPLIVSISLSNVIHLNTNSCFQDKSLCLKHKRLYWTGKNSNKVTDFLGSSEGEML